MLNILLSLDYWPRDSRFLDWMGTFGKFPNDFQYFAD